MRRGEKIRCSEVKLIPWLLTEGKKNSATSEKTGKGSNERSRGGREQKKHKKM